MTVQIDDDVPMPRNARGPEPKYPFADLRIGSSFFVKDAVPHRLSSAASHWAKTTGRKFRVRTVDGGVRVWRMK